ncbi:3-oxoacyl-[acyl-carrier-protein] reductase FabG [Halotydeus destructor]|nr:3-oxoacyl-[acyl-carrier-protein] reductase FabG [Halotydeus destructor]
MSAREFEGKVVLITGSASGIGRTTADLFAAKGANLILCDLNEAGLTEVSDEIVNKHGVQTYILAGNLTDGNVLGKLVQDGVAKLGQLDVVVNNAGICGLRVPVDSEDSMKAFDSIMAVNLRAAYQLCAIAAPYLILSKGNIVNVSSIAAHTAMKGFSAYCISKAAMSMMTKCLAFELGMQGVRVNEVRPTWTDTPMLDSANADEEAKEAAFEQIRNQFVPMKKTAVPLDIARAVVHLAASEQHMVNGSVYTVDAGFSVRGIAFD